MEAIPNNRHKITEETTNNRRDNDERHSCCSVKRFDGKRHTEHVRPENEVRQCLRPSERDENGPHEMKTANQNAKSECHLGRADKLVHGNNVIRLTIS